MIDMAKIVSDGKYLIESTTGEKVVFYECDPKKNIECDKALCRLEGNEDEGGFGFCAKTADPRFRKNGGKAWYAVLKTPDEGEPYWGREYIEVI